MRFTAPLIVLLLVTLWLGCDYGRYDDKLEGEKTIVSYKVDGADSLAYFFASNKLDSLDYDNRFLFLIHEPGGTGEKNRGNILWYKKNGFTSGAYPYWYGTKNMVMELGLNINHQNTADSTQYGKTIFKQDRWNICYISDGLLHLEQTKNGKSYELKFQRIN